MGLKICAALEAPERRSRTHRPCRASIPRSPKCRDRHKVSATCDICKGDVGVQLHSPLGMNDGQEMGSLEGGHVLGRLEGFALAEVLDGQLSSASNSITDFDKTI